MIFPYQFLFASVFIVTNIQITLYHISNRMWDFFVVWDAFQCKKTLVK